jgi:hypothetical protein
MSTITLSGCVENPSNSNTTKTSAGTSIYQVDVYDQKKAYRGTTLFSDTHNSTSPKIVEVDMNGNVVWEYTIPRHLIKGATVGPDVELLQNKNILFVMSNSGVYEIDRNGTIVWSYLDPKVSHDADRLASGNTLVVFGNNDTKADAQVKEVNSAGKIVWEWYAKDVYGNDTRYKDIEIQGWTHANAVQRLKNGNTMISLRNFYLTVIVDKGGKVVREYNWSKFGKDTDPHEPEIHEDNNTLLTCLQNDAPYVSVEISMVTEEVLWTHTDHNMRTARDSNRLPNNNVLIVGVNTSGTSNMQDDISTIIEVTPSGEIVWRLSLKSTPVGNGPGWFYKAERISPQ